MNRVEISAEEEPPPLWAQSLKNYALKALERIGRDKWDLSILLCGDRTISELNSRYRGKDEATDVLSFTMNEGGVSAENFLMDVLYPATLLSRLIPYAKTPSVLKQAKMKSCAAC